MLNKKILLIGLLIVSLVLTACGGIGAPTTVKIVSSMPLELGIGKDIVNAAQLALKKAGGKAGNLTVELVSLSMSQPGGSPFSAELEQKNVDTALKDPAVVAYFGPLTSSSTKVDLPQFNKASMTQIGVSATWPGLTKPGYGPGEPGIYYPTGKQNFFRTVPSDEKQAAAGARWAVRLGFKKVYIAVGDDPYGNGLAGVFEITAKDEALSIVGKEIFKTDTGAITPTEFKTIATRILATKPDMVYIAGGVGSNADLLLGALRDQNPTIAIMGPDGLASDDLIAAVGADKANNVYGTTIALPADKLGTPAANEFLKDYQAAYGKAPGAYEAAAYEAMNVLLAAIAKAKQPTREGVLEAMQNLGDFSGIFGTWRFNSQGDISISGISGLQVKNGAWVFVEALK